MSRVMSWMESPRSNEKRVAKLFWKDPNLSLPPNDVMPIIKKDANVGMNPIMCMPIFGKEYKIIS